MEKLIVEPIPSRNWKVSKERWELVYGEREKERKKSDSRVNERIYYMWFNYLQLCLDLERIGYEVPKVEEKEQEIDVPGGAQALDTDLEEAAMLFTDEEKEKERVVKGMKKSFKGFRDRYGPDAKSVMYATATKKAKEAGDTSKSDKRYAYEETQIDELNRYAKETGKNTGSLNKRAGSPVRKGGSDDKALQVVQRMIRKDYGKPEGQQKKVKGKKK